MMTHHEHSCLQIGCNASVPCDEMHVKAGMTTQPACAMHVVRVRGVYACPSCDGMGTFAQRYDGRRVTWVPCWFCNGTGDQRQMPTAWRNCPSRNVLAFRESSGGRS